MPTLAGIDRFVGTSAMLLYTPGLAVGATCRWVAGPELVLGADSADVGLVLGADDTHSAD